MRPWTWTKRVITDQTGGTEPIPVALERNPGAVVELGAHNPPDVPLYVLRVGIEAGFGRQQAGLPVYRRENPSSHPILKEIYHCEVAGKTLEAANIYALRTKVQHELEVIAPGHGLPLCFFRAPRFDYALAVYEEGHELVCPVLAGPKLKADTLAELRGPVVRFLQTGGYLMPEEEPDVQVVRPSDLRLVPPAAVIRCLEDDDIWMPTVEGTSADGPVVGLLVHPAELAGSRRLRRAAAETTPPPSAPDVTALLRYLSNEMTVRGTLGNPWALYAAHVRPEIWARTEELTEPTPRRLTCLLEGGEPLEVPIRHTAAGESVGAIREAGISVFVAGDNDALAHSVGRYLEAGGFLRDARELRPEVVREAPPEHLDPDSIWTGPPAGLGGPPSTEAVPPTGAAASELSVQETIHEDREVETT